MEDDAKYNNTERWDKAIYNEIRNPQQKLTFISLTAGKLPNWTSDGVLTTGTCCVDATVGGSGVFEGWLIDPNWIGANKQHHVLGYE